MLQKKGDAVTPVLIDFGLSVHFRKSGGKTSPKGVMGVTDGFAPLEQYAGIQEFNPTTDVYALAATFLYCLTGRIPAKASELRLQDVRKAVGDKLGEEELEGLCRALCKSSDDRTQSVARLKVDLGIVTSGGNGTVEIRKGDDSRPNWLKWALIGGLVVGAAAVIWFVTGSRSEDSMEEKGDALPEKKESIDSAVVEPPAEAVGQIVVTQEYIDSLAHAKADSIRRAEAASAAPATQSTPSSPTTPTSPTPAKPNVTSGTLNLGYATWSGGILDGKPHGSGRLTFHSSHAVDRHSSVQASPGDYFNATYENGQLISGKLYDSAGNLLKTIIP